jgi:quercetin dioxygenase-like cupin family protein
MDLHFHDELEPARPYAGLTRLITMEQQVGAAAITTGLVTLAPGHIVRPHTHLVEEAITLLSGDALVLVGSETVEVRGRRATFVAPGNTVHGLRNIGTSDLVLCIAYPAVGVTSTFAEGVTI